MDMAKDNDSKEKKVSFKDTLNLPRTDFPMRPNAKEDDPKMIERWESEDLYTKTFYKNLFCMTGLPMPMEISIWGMHTTRSKKILLQNHKECRENILL